MKKILLNVLWVLLLIGSHAYAQTRTVTGVVTGKDDGQPIAGVSVIIKGTRTGTQTGVNGRFSLSVPQNSTLVFSFIGYLTQEAPASGNLNMVLVSAPNQLNEVVVIPYGTAKREAITGSVAVLGSKDLERRTVTNVTSALQGLAPGITVLASNGQPGASATIRIRGFGSYSASSSPLYVLDGSVFDGNLGDISPADIENVSVLKDASSSALYGSRAANGVILITTKRGKTATPTISATFNQGYSTRGIPEYDRLDAYQYYPAVWQGIKNNLMYSASPVQTEAVASQNATNTVASLLVYNPFNVPNNQVVGTDGKLNPNASLIYNEFDWYKPLQRVGNRTEANLSTSARTDKSDYYVSLNYLKDNGYILKSDFKRFNARINVNTKVKSWLRTGLNLSGSSSDANIASDNSTDNNTSFINPFSFARGIGPIYPVHAYDATGNRIYNTALGLDYYDYGQHPGAINRPSGASPGRNVVYETMLNDNLYRRNLLSARSFIEVKFLKDFTFTPTISIDMRNNNANVFQNAIVGDGAGSNGTLTVSNNTIKSFTFNQILSYNKTINEHNFSALVGHENYDFTYRTFNTYRTNQTVRGITELDNFVTAVSSGGRSDRDRIESYLSKFGYNYAGKYFLDGSLRRDGSSRFAKDNRWGTFFSVGGSWAISKESFLKDVSWLDDLKLKASYGQVGNNALLAGSPPAANYYGYDAFYDLAYNNGTEGGVLLSSKATPNLKWESQNTTNLGVSFSFFKRRLYGELEVYKKSVDNLLFAVPQPLSDPVTTVNQNIGSMYNKGIELQLAGDIIRSKNFTWNLLTNWTMFKNKITKLPAESPTIVSGTKKREKGQDLYQFWLRQYAGVDPADGSALYLPAEGTAAANIRTVNGVQYVTNQSFAKLDYSGTAIPDLSGSFTNTLAYKGISLSFLVTYQIGGKFYDSNYQGLMSTAAYGGALHKDILNSWTQTNTTSNIPRADYGNSTNINATSSRWLIDASYLSFRNVNLSYTLPRSLLGKLDVSSVRLFVNGENLHLFSKRKGLDPSEAIDGVNANTYTQSRAISFGLNLSL